MKRNKKLIKRLKAKSKKNFLSKKMSCDNVFCLKNTIVKIERDRSYIKLEKDFAKMQGDHPPVNMKGDHVFVDMNGEHPRVKPVSNKNNKEQ